MLSQRGGASSARMAVTRPLVSRGDHCCVHLAHWLVDIKSHRVVRQPCALCEAVGGSGSEDADCPHNGSATADAGRSGRRGERMSGLS